MRPIMSSALMRTFIVAACDGPLFAPVPADAPLASTAAPVPLPAPGVFTQPTSQSVYGSEGHR